METLEIVMPGVVEPEQLEQRRRVLAPLAEGRVRVAVEATGVSFAEVQMRRNRYPGQPPFPFVPGYDVVGRVIAVGPSVSPSLLGTRVAAMTLIGGWAEHVALDAADLIPAPEGLDAAEVVSLIVNGATAWKMLHRIAKVRAGQTVVVHGAAGGVGNTLVQLARLAGVAVIGTCNQNQAAGVAAMGAHPIDYRRGDVLAAVRAIAPQGVAAVFDHVGGKSLDDSWRMLGDAGTLVSYGNASTRDDRGSAWTPIVRNMARAFWWNLIPGRRRAHVFDVWGRSSLGANQMLRPARFRRELREDVTEVLSLLAAGKLRASVAARFPIAAAGDALRFHERGTAGKVVLVAGLVQPWR